MNERLKELAKQAAENENGCSYEWDSPFVERLAKLVEAAAVAREREACVKLCDIYANNGASFMCAAAIKARSNDESLFNN